jgi:hypothetical protein
MRTLVIQEGEETRTINYSVLSNDDINQRIQEYECKYGETYYDFYSSFDCGEAGMDELTHPLDWENLVKEKKVRMEKAAYEVT